MPGKLIAEHHVAISHGGAQVGGCRFGGWARGWRLGATLVVLSWWVRSTGRGRTAGLIAVRIRRRSFSCGGFLIQRRQVRWAAGVHLPRIGWRLETELRDTMTAQRVQDHDFRIAAGDAR